MPKKTLYTHVYRVSNILRWCINSFWHALQGKPEAAATESELQDPLSNPPSLAEFKSGIKDAKMHSAPGMSDLSYNMPKSLPDKAIEYYHICFTQFWLSDRV